jgi:Spy/CpxP family protein refolding chaperone
MKPPVLKTLTFAAALCVAVPMSASGADAPAGKRGAAKGAMGGKLDEALGKLDLNEEQKTKVEACKAKFRDYMQSHAEELKAAREETDPEKKREAMKGLFGQMKEMMDGIRAVLTDAQKKKLDELMPARMGDGKGKGRAKGAPTQ